jgi:hypothetical protein
MHKPNNQKKYFFNDFCNLINLHQLELFKKEAGLEGCVIGGNAVSANHINYIQQNTEKFDLNLIKEYINNFSRPTSDIDIIINGNMTENFEELLLKYFGEYKSKLGKNNELDITLDNDSPYLSFHFLDNGENSQSKYFKDFVQNAKKLLFKSNSFDYECSFADPLDLVIMKLKSCSTRTNKAKKDTDLIDLQILIDINKYTISQIKKRAVEINYTKDYCNEIKESLSTFVGYILKNNKKELANKKLKIMFENNANNLKNTIDNLF